MVEMRKESNPTRCYIANMKEGVFKAQLYPLYHHDVDFGAIASKCYTDDNVQRVKAELQKVLPKHLVQTDEDVLYAVTSICGRIVRGADFRTGIDF